MQECQITTALVHTILEKKRIVELPQERKRFSLPMKYQEYTPTTTDVNYRFRSSSFCTEKNKFVPRLEKKKIIKPSSVQQKDEVAEITMVPTKIAVQFQAFPNRTRKNVSRQVEVADYNSLMVDSMKKYITKVQKGKIKKKERCERIRSFGVNICRINCQDIKDRIQERKRLQNTMKLDREKMIKEKSVSIPFSSTTYDSIGTRKSESQKNSNEKCKTEKSDLPQNEKSQIKKYFIKDEKKDDQRSIQNKMSRMLNFFSIFLSSFGVYQDRPSTLYCLNSSAKKKLKKFSYFVGSGNNKNLIVSIFKKRWWWTESESMSSADFVWTQLKVKSVMKKQKSMKNSEISDLQIEKYRIDPSITKLKKIFLSISKTYLNIFHEQHSQRFYEKLKENEEKDLLRQIKTPNILHNHYQANYMLGNKKALFKNMKEYCQFFDKNVFDFIPVTYHVETIQSKAFQNFEKKAKSSKNDCWIVKPGQNSNQGNGIFVSNSFGKIKNKIEKSKKHTFIIQKYLKNVFLFQRRKFDIRTYLVLVSIGGVKKFYWYSEGYLRTCSQYYDLSDLDDPYVHLTNDAIQHESDNYGKFQKGNKITYYEFQRYLDINYPKQKYSLKTLIKNMKQIAKEVAKATYFKIDPCQKQCNFQLFGLDFLIDCSFKPWLLQVNTNPCLKLSSPVLDRLVPRMIQNLFRITVDPLFQPAYLEPSRTLSCFIPDNILENNHFELIFDSLFDRLPEWQKHCEEKEVEVYEDQNQEFDGDGQIININD